MKNVKDDNNAKNIPINVKKIVKIEQAMNHIMLKQTIKNEKNRTKG